MNHRKSISFFIYEVWLAVVCKIPRESDVCDLFLWNFNMSEQDEHRCSVTKNIINEHIPFRCRCYRSLILQMQVLSLGLHPRFNETVSFMFSPTNSLLCLFPTCGWWDNWKLTNISTDNFNYFFFRNHLVRMIVQRDTNCPLLLNTHFFIAV